MPEMHSDDNDPLQPQKDSYEDSPRQKLPGQSAQRAIEDDENDKYDEEGEENNYDGAEEEEFDEDEMIDVAEKIFIRVAEQII